MTLRLPRMESLLAIVDERGFPNLSFHQWWDQAMTQIEAEFGAVEAALIAQQAAADAQAAADQVAAAGALTSSYPQGVSIAATDAGTDATVTISAHTRIYADGTSASVNSGVLTGLLYDTSYWIAYDDPTRSGGAVTYVAYTTPQGNGTGSVSRHFVGAVQTPTSGGLDTDGVGSQPPGGISPRELDGGDLP